MKLDEILHHIVQSGNNCSLCEHFEPGPEPEEYACGHKDYSPAWFLDNCSRWELNNDDKTKLKQWAIGALPKRKHSCGSCDITENEQAEITGFNACVDEAIQTINKAN